MGKQHGTTSHFLLLRLAPPSWVESLLRLKTSEEMGGQSYLHILYPKILGTLYLISLLLPPLRGRCGARVPGTFL